MGHLTTRQHLPPLKEETLSTVQEPSQKPVIVLSDSTEHERELQQTTPNLDTVNNKNCNDVALNCDITQQTTSHNDIDKSSDGCESDAIEPLLGLLDKLNKYKREDDAEIFKFILKSLSNASENVIGVKKGCKNTKEKKVLNNIIKILHEAGYSSEIISILTGQTSNMISNTIIKMQERKEIANCEITKKIATPETKLSDLLGEEMFGRALCEINYEKQQISIRAPLPVKS